MARDPARLAQSQRYGQRGLASVGWFQAQVSAEADPPEPDLATVRGAKATWLAYPAMSLGALAVCIAFAMSRNGVQGAAVVYWSGQLTVVAGAIVVCLSRSPTVAERLTALLLLAGLQSLLVWAYSPEQFRFPDELQHLRTARDIVASGHLFTPNSALPVGPGFPGLEIVTTALSELSGLSVFAAGVVVASVSHMILVAAVFAWARAFGFLPRSASVAALVYGFAPGYPYFDILFTYTAIALPFFVLAARAAARHLSGRRAALGVIPPMLVAVVSHHLTGYLTIAIVGMVAALVGLARQRRRALWLVGAAVFGAAVAAVWTIAFSPNSLDYLLTPSKVALANVFGLARTSAGDAAVRGVAAPAWQRGLGYVGTALLLGLTIAGAIVIWKQRRRAGWRRYIGVIAVLLYLAVLGVRVLSADGPELATRLLTYPMLLICLPITIVLCGWWDGIRRRGRLLSGLAALVGAASVLVVSLPQAWERLPGRFHVAGADSGVDARVGAAASYVTATAAPGSRIACDLTVCSLVSGQAHVTAATDAAPMFYASTVGARRIEIEDLGLDVVIVDNRMSQQPPYTGAYFAGQVRYGRTGEIYPARLLAQFAADDRLARMYDNGAIAVYDTNGLLRGQP